MSACDRLIRELEREEIGPEVRDILDKYRSKPRKAPKKFSGKGSRVGKLGIVRLKGLLMNKLRLDAFHRDYGLCQLRLEGCAGFAAFEVGHLSHVRGKRNNGDILENVRWSCASCHAKSHNAGGKPCPRKDGSYA